jgi:hypothetical protein
MKLVRSCGPWLLGGTSVVFVLWTSVVPAMLSIETDFSNYYLPARLLARGAPTSDLYDFSWFQRQMVYAGIEDQAGGFNGFPPPAGLVMLPLGWLEPLAAKRAWTLVNLAALGGLLALLRRMAGLPLHWGLALAAAAGFGLRNNFLYGQFYLILTLLLAGTLRLRERGRGLAAGALLGIAAAVKIYPAPLLLYFASRREWALVAGFSLSVGAALGGSVLALGWDVNAFFLGTVLPRSLGGGADNPFHPALQSLASLLRQLFVSEPTLHPAPFLFESRFLFQFFQTMFLGSVLGGLILALRRRGDVAAASVLIIGLLLVSPVVHSYHLLLLLLPVAFWATRLWRARRPWPAAAVVFLYVLSGSPLALRWPELRLRFVVLVALMLVLAWQLRPFRLPRWSYPALVSVSAAHALVTVARLDATVVDGAVAIAWPSPRSESPAAAFPGRLVFAALEGERYRIRGDSPPDLLPAGDLFAPQWAASGESLFFEVAAAGRSRIVERRGDELVEWTPPEMSCMHPSPSADGRLMVASCGGDVFLFRRDPRYPSPSSHRLTATLADEIEPGLSPDGRRVIFAVREGAGLTELDLATRSVRRLTADGLRDRHPRYCPQGGHVAFSRREMGTWDVWILDLTSGRESRLTRHAANDTHPAWSPDGRSVYFASDRGRGIFMPAIYRLELPGGV